MARLDPNILVEVGGRTLVDIPRAVALIDSMPRGPRKPNGGGKGRKRGPERCQRRGGGHDQAMIFVFATVP